MTISIESSVATYTGNGSLAVFDVKDGSNGIYFAAASELVVTIDGVLRTLTTHYTVSGAGTAAGQVTFLTAPANGTEVRIRRDTPRVQELDLSQGSTYDPASVETQLDRIVRAVQDVGWIAENPDQVDVTITVGTVTTGAPGSSVIVAVTEDPDGTFEFDFTIPRGDQGASGAGTGDMLAAQNLNDLASKKTGFDNISIRGADIASAGTIDLDAATGNLIDVTGTTSITAITLADGRERTVRFTGILTLTNGASLVLPTGANIPTAAGDFARFRGYAAGVVRCVAYQRASGAPLVLIDGSVTTAKIADDAVTYAKMQNVSAASRLLGRGDSGAGDTQEIALGTGLSMTGTTLNASTATAATQAEEEAAASTTVFTTPGRQQFHPGVAKAWVNFNSAATVAASYNITSVTDNAVGNWTVNIATDFSSANYVGVAMGGWDSPAALPLVYSVVGITAGTFQINARAPYEPVGCVSFVLGTLKDPIALNQIHVVFFGDQA